MGGLNWRGAQHGFGRLDVYEEITDAWLVTHKTRRPHDNLRQMPALMTLPRPDALTSAPAASTIEASPSRGSLQDAALHPHYDQAPRFAVSENRRDVPYAQATLKLARR